MTSSVKYFEDLPDEIILSVCRYLSQVNILDSFLNLNIRLNRTISSYREQIYLSHLTKHEFNRILHYYLPFLSLNVHYLYINTCSMINVGKFFENSFSKIDLQFPLLKELVLYQIDIETLENLSWRFNTMKNLYRLDIDISNECLSSQPSQFDEFLCGKLFSSANSFEILRLNFTKYYFNVETIKQKCTNLRQLTISILRIKDLFLLFDCLPNLERFDLTLACSSANNTNITPQTFPFEHLWWKVPRLTQFSLTITDRSLAKHDNIPTNEFILNLIQNLYSLEYFRFIFHIQFHSSLQLTTNRDVYVNTYLPFLDGTLWERALQRSDQRNIQFEMYVELDGVLTNYFKETTHSNQNFVNKYEGEMFKQKRRRMKSNDLIDLDIDFQAHLKNTFSSSYWLQKNISFDCLISTSKHVSISTCPITLSDRTTIDDIINEEILKKSNNSHQNIENLLILSNSEYQSSNICLTDLFHRYRKLIHLNINSRILLPPIQTICSTRLRSLVLHNCQLEYCSQLLPFLPQVISLTVNNFEDNRMVISSDSFNSITRLKLVCNMFNIQNLPNLEKNFLRLKEFYLTIENFRNSPLKIENLAFEFRQLQYAEICLPYDKHSHIDIELDTQTIYRRKSSNNRYLILQKWV